MGIGIIVCGLNGSGKSTLGKALAEKLGFHFIDNEDLFFGEKDASYVYSEPRTRQEAEKILLNKVIAYENFVFSAVKGDYGKEIIPFYKYAVFIDVPADIRMSRVRSRSFQKFGDRMLPGGDLYEQEEVFFNMAAARTEDYVEEWLKSLNCPVIQVDGTRPIEENINFITEKIQL